MKKSILLFALGILISSCTLDKEAEFVGLQKPRVVSANLKEVQLQANAYFYNPNSLGINIKSSDIDVLMGEKNLGKAVTQAIDVPAKDTFAVPLRLSIPVKELIQDKKGLLQGVISTLSTQEIELQYKGTITLDILNIEYPYEVDEKQTFQLKHEKH